MVTNFYRVMLTGGSGMVGRNILEHRRAKARVFLAPGKSDLNLFNFDSVKSYIEKERPDIIIHAAGKVGGIHANMANPVGFLLENLDMGRNVILAARQCGVKALINLGSSCMYPRNASNPLTESLLLHGELEPTNEGYALAKIVASKLCDYISRENTGYSYKTLIPCNLYGRWDKFSPENSHMIPGVIRKLHLAKTKGDKTVDIWGDGTARREFLYAGDMADCIHHALDNFTNLPNVMNIGLGRDYSVEEYYQAVAGVVGYTGSFFYDLSKPAGMARKLVDVSKMHSWGWTPSTSLSEGLKLSYEFYKSMFGDKE